MINGLKRLEPSDIKVLRLKPGTSVETIQPGCHVFENSQWYGPNYYRGLVVHRAPSGNHVWFCNRIEKIRGAKVHRGIWFGKTSLRKYTQGTGRINYGGGGFICLPMDEIYPWVDGRLYELGHPRADFAEKPRKKR